jgi:predicted nuclease of predicted toxin-antitoxin system
MFEFLAITRLCRTSIYSEAWLRRGDQDTFCPDVSFEAARHSDEVMITADVDFDIALVLNGPAPDVTAPKTLMRFGHGRVRS